MIGDVNIAMTLEMLMSYSPLQVTGRFGRNEETGMRNGNKEWKWRIGNE